MRVDEFQRTPEGEKPISPTGKKRKVLRGDHVFIGQDCREGVPSAAGQEAVYLGHYWYGTARRYRGPKEHLLEVNPRFRLPDGSFIWGVECWWALLPRELREKLKPRNPRVKKWRSTGKE